MKINKNQPKGKATKTKRAGKRAALAKDKFRSSFSGQRRGQKITKKDMKQAKREFSKDKSQRGKGAHSKTQETKEKPELTHKEKRRTEKVQQKQSDAIAKIQFDEGLKKGFSEDRLKEIIRSVKMRGLKQRMAKRLTNHFKTQ